ncbi:hypothetical protein [Hydrogenovibrio sp. SC-1]|uniref:hypothetical protein n=1 Tax=Hydrogenovibrio sp. SC-1 TaxID=2065820 RepID=UPI0013047AFC|nr:hypothetical protein [Hydrogenovibrio sp. SC-1]
MLISCHLYDQLERAAIQKQVVRLQFDSSASQSEFEGVILDLFSRKGREFLKAKNGQEWPLSGLVSIETIQKE